MGKMIEITSVSNDLVKETVKLHQKKYRENFFIVEGKKAVSGAIEAGFEIKHAFSSDKNLLETYKNTTCYLANEKVMEKISTTESPATVVAVVKKPVYDFNCLKKMKKMILLDSIKDAGNLGTIIRTAAAFGADGLILANDCTDEFSPKTIRASVGTIFKLPVFHCKIDRLKELKKDFQFISTVVNSKKSLKEITPKTPYIVMFGSEADGLCEELLNLADVTCTISMKKNVESLNLAVSAGVVLYEILNK